jgi:hypothetical protein
VSGGHDLFDRHGVAKLGERIVDRMLMVLGATAAIWRWVVP